jgi:transposase-like protein
MNASDFEIFLRQFKQLSSTQRRKAGERLASASKSENTAEFIEATSAKMLACPHCSCRHVHRHGHAHGLQRYRCTACRKTFNPLTKTPLARLRHKDKWRTYLQCLLDSLTVRKAAMATGVHRNTSFRWRHRFLEWVKNDRPTRLHGIAEADEAYLLESEKGCRHLARRARKRGGAASQRGTSKEQVCILIARDRTGQTLDFVTGRGPVSKAQLHACLPTALDDDTLLVSDSNAVYKYFALEAGITHEAINLRAGIRVRGAIHVQNVNAYHSRLRGWIRQFHGVATRYLPNYLGWLRGVDSKRLNTPEILLSAALGVFPHLPGT